MLSIFYNWIIQLGPIDAIWDPTAAHPHDAEWALRAKRAHYNAVENLVVFAPLVILVHILGVADGLTASRGCNSIFFRPPSTLFHIYPCDSCY